MSEPLNFGNTQWDKANVSSVQATTAPVTARPKWLKLNRDNWRLFDMGRVVFDQATAKQKRAWKLVKQAKGRSKRKTNTVQRVGSMKALKVRCFTRQRTAVKLFNALMDVAIDHPNKVMIHQSYLYNVKEYLK